MLKNAYFLAKIGADTAENDQHFAEILQKTGNYPTPPPARAGGSQQMDHGYDLKRGGPQYDPARKKTVRRRRRRMNYSLLKMDNLYMYRAGTLVG